MAPLLPENWNIVEKTFVVFSLSAATSARYWLRTFLYAAVNVKAPLSQ